MTGQVRTREEGGVCTITLENEGKRNAISYPMMEELASTLESLDGAEDDAVVVLRGAGDVAFSAGFDLTQERRTDDGSWDRMIEAVAGHDYPTVAMLDGHAFGGAVHLAAACDLRIGRPDTQLGIPAAKLGIVYPPDAMERLVALVGPAQTKELLLVGDPIDAEAAHEIGLVDHLVDADEMEAFTYEMAETMAGNAPFAVTAMKRIVDEIVGSGSLADEDREWARSLRRESYATRDYEEGTAAFAEGREPEFEGR